MGATAAGVAAGLSTGLASGAAPHRARVGQQPRDPHGPGAGFGHRRGDGGDGVEPHVASGGAAEGEAQAVQIGPAHGLAACVVDGKTRQGQHHDALILKGDVHAEGRAIGVVGRSSP